MFFNLHTHTHESKRDGYSTPEEVVNRVVELGQTAVAITNHGTMSGSYETWKLATKAGLKYIFGCEMYFTFDVNVESDNIKHIIFYAKNAKGLENLYQLVSEGHRNFYRKPRVDLDIIRKYSEGLVCTTACMGGVLAMANGEKVLLGLLDIFKDDLYIEIHTYAGEAQVSYNQMAIALAKKYGIKCVPACDSHYAKKSDYLRHRSFVVGDMTDDTRYTCDRLYLMDENDVRRYLGAMKLDIKTDILFSNQRDMVDSMDIVNPNTGHFYPSPPVANPKDHIRKKIWTRCKELGIDKDEKYLNRIRIELDVLEKCDYLNYFAIMDDIVTFARCNNIPVGIGRGSAVGVLVAYLLGITGVDPLKHDLLLERFVHLDRVSPPDIDVDFPQSRRQEIIEHIRQRFGEVYHVRTPSYMGDASAVRRAVATNGLHVSIADKLLDAIVDLEHAPKRKPIDDITQETYENIIEIANNFLGRIQSYGVHASGIVVMPDHAYKWTSIERQVDSDGNVRYVTAYEFKHLEECGLLKLDILGLATLDVIYGALEMAGHGIDFDWRKHFDNPEPYGMIAKGETDGLFQLESPGMRDTARRVATSNVDDITAVVALYRPGTKDSGMLEEYLLRKEGKNPVVYDHPKLEGTLKETYGIIVYQEQIMRAAQEMAGYTLGEADMLRRAIGKKDAEATTRLVAEFVDRCIANGVDPASAQIVADKIVTFANYGFNKCIAGSESLWMAQNKYTRNAKPYLTIEEVYLRMQDGRYKERSGRYTLSLTEDRKLCYNRVVDIKYSGILPVYKITVGQGRSVKLTANHSVPTHEGDKLVCDLKVGDVLHVLKHPRQYSRGVRKGVIQSIEHAGYEKCYDVEMTAPYHNYMVSSGIVVNNSHAVAYAYTAWQTALVKWMYPREFWASLMNSKMGEYKEMAKYHQAAPVKVYPPSLEVGNNKWEVYKDGVIVGLTAIKYVPHNLHYKPSNNLNEFIRDNPHIDKRTLESLIKAGCFGDDVGNLLGQLPCLIEYHKSIAINTERYHTHIANGKQRYADMAYAKMTAPPPTDIKPVDVDIVDAETSVLGFSFHDKLARYDLKYVNNIDIIADEVLEVKDHFTKKGNPMQFVKCRQRELVYFSPKRVITAGNVYLFKIKPGSTIINDVAEARLKESV